MSLRVVSEQFDLARRAHHLAQRERRSRKTLGRRLDEALAYAARMSEKRAGVVGRMSPSSESAAGPQKAPGLLFEPGEEDTYSKFQRRLRIAVEALEREVDAARLRPISGEADLETTEERDKRLLEYVRQGIPIKEIALLDDGLGDEAAIRAALRRLAK